MDRNRHLPRSEENPSVTDPAVLGNPIDFIHEDYRRERQICSMIEKVAAAEVPASEDIGEILSFLKFELPFHFADEEQDLFPLVRRRSTPDDEIEWAIARLAAQNEITRADAQAVIAVLGSIEAHGQPPSSADRALLLRYAAQARRHLTLENAIILPFARLRLTAHDLETLRLRMLKRRGLDQLLETRNAE